MNYKIETIAEHSLIPSLLPEKGFIIDAGCRNFQFRDAMKAMGHKVYAIDCDLLDDPCEEYYRFALSNKNGFANISRTNDPQATSITTVDTGEVIECMTLEAFSQIRGPLHGRWDLIKLDIEGSEYEVIMAMEKAITRQLSVEFHMHTGVYDMKELEEMENHLHDLGYEFIQHKLSAQHGLGENYWDSLFLYNP